MKLSFTLAKVNPKWIKDLRIRPKTLQLLLENVGSTFQHTGTGTDFLNKTPKIQEIKPIISKGDSIIRKFLHSNGNKGVKREPTEW